MQESLVERPRDLGQVQADELRVKKQGGIVWMALAMMVKTRLWLGGEVSEQRDLPLIRRLIERVRRCAARRPLLVCTDGLVSYIRAIRETFRDPVHTGKGGRPRLRPWRHVLIAQVIKRYERRRVVETDRRIVDGTPARVETLRHRSQGDGVINTAYIERLNATFRERLAPLARRCRALARHTLTLHEGMFLVGTVYNFCTPHESLYPAQADDAGHGRWDHRPLLDDARTAVVSGAAASLGTTEAAWASFTGTATLDRAMVLVTTVNCGATAEAAELEIVISEIESGPRREIDIADSHIGDPALIANSTLLRGKRGEGRWSVRESIYCSLERCPNCPHGDYLYEYFRYKRKGIVRVKLGEGATRI